MHAERLALCNGKRINTWKEGMQRHVQERVLVVMNLLIVCWLSCLKVRFLRKKDPQPSVRSLYTRLQNGSG
jgi:hypothetical protein